MGSVDSSALRCQRVTARNMSSRFFQQVILGWYQISALLRVIFFFAFSFLPTTHLWSKFVDHLHSWYFLLRSPSAQKNQGRLWWPFTINTRIFTSFESCLFLHLLYIFRFIFSLHLLEIIQERCCDCCYVFLMAWLSTLAFLFWNWWQVMITVLSSHFDVESWLLFSLRRRTLGLLSTLKPLTSLLVLSRKYDIINREAIIHRIKNMPAYPFTN